MIALKPKLFLFHFKMKTISACFQIQNVIFKYHRAKIQHILFQFSK